MQLPPLEVIEAWPAPNYAHPSGERGPTILILTSILIPIMFLLVGLRIYSRVHLSKNFGPDDVALIAAVFPTVACASLALVAVFHYGWSRHVWDVPVDQLVMGLKYIIAVEILFVAGVSLTKISMLLLIRRIMAPGSDTLRWLSIALIVVVSLDCFIYLVVTVNTCSPVSEYWTLSFEPQNCFNEAAHLLAAGIINTVTDFCVVLIPIPVVLKLRLPLRQRIACAMLFGAGFFVCIAAAVRMAYTYELNNTYDKTWIAYPVFIAGTIELYLGIFATSIPAIKPLASRYFPKILGSSFNKYGQSSSGDYVKSIEPHIEMSTSTTVFSEHNDFISDEIFPPKPHSLRTATALSVSKNKPLLPSSTVSIFSPYNKTPKRSNTVDDWTRQPTPWDEIRSSKASLSSFDVAYQAAEKHGLGAPTHVRNVESREKLVMKWK